VILYKQFEYLIRAHVDYNKINLIRAITLSLPVYGGSAVRHMNN